MNERERYLFDLQGFLHIPGLLTAQEAAALREAAIELEQHALACRDEAKRWMSVWGHEYWQHPDEAYFARVSGPADGQTMLVEDFWLHGDAFDSMIGHPKTMAYVRGIIQSEITINNSELRVRYPGNATRMHMGHPQGRHPKYRYEVIDGNIEASMVRMIYFLHDVKMDEGPTCFVPGSHRNAFGVPEGFKTPEEEPGVVGIEVKAGDGILFTEACRHGGFANLSDTTRYTLHVGYGPSFLKSQNTANLDEPVQAPASLLSRLTETQRSLLVCPRRQPIEPSDAKTSV